jgi:transcriptional regulator with XRE-family HTH domain
MIEVLKQAIRGCGLPMYVLAERAGVTNGQLSRFMRGERTLRADTVEKLCKVLGLKLVPAARKRALSAK